MASVPFLTIARAAKEMGLGADRLQEWIKNGWLVPYQVSERLVLVRPEDIDVCVKIAVEEYASERRRELRDEKREVASVSRGKRAPHQGPVGEDQTGSTSFVPVEVYAIGRKKKRRRNPRAQTPDLRIAD